MYQYIIPARILFALGLGFLIFSLVFGWVSFSVPDWLQLYEKNKLPNGTVSDNNDYVLKKFGLWYKCIFSADSNDFFCILWNKDAPHFVDVAQILVPFGLALGCLSFISALFALICRRAFVTTVLISALLSFLSFVFITIGLTVFATESLVYVNNLKIPSNENPRRWGMWLLIPNIILSFLTFVCFTTASILNWCDYRNMQVTGILSHSADKLNGSVFKGLSDSNTTTVLKQQYPSHQDYPNACYQLNGMNNNQQNTMGYPPPPSYGGLINSAYQTTPPGLFGYSRPGSPTMNPMYPHANFDSYYPRQYMGETLDTDASPRMSRSRHRSRSRRHSEYRSRSNSPAESTVVEDNNNNNNNNQKQTQFIPIPVPYYHPQQMAAPQPTKMQTQPLSTNNNQPTMPYIIPQAKQYVPDDNNMQSGAQTTNIFKYGNTTQQPLFVSNPTQPVYTIAYRANNGGNVLSPNIITGPAGATYVTASRNHTAEITSLSSESEKEENSRYQSIAKPTTSKKISINEAWTWRKM